MEKTKFIRVAVEERLGKKDKGVLFFNENTNSCAFLRNSTDFIIHYEFTHWLEEIPDREYEMMQMLEELKSSHSELFRRLNQANNVYKIKTPSIENALENASKIIEKYSQNEDNEKLIQSVKQTK